MRQLAVPVLALLSVACTKPIPPPADVAAPPADAQVTASGLAYKVLQEADGPKPAPTDTVTVHYTGWTTDGEMFDSSVARGEPSTFPLTGVIAGWTMGVPADVGRRPSTACGFPRPSPTRAHPGVRRACSSSTSS